MLILKNTNMCLHRDRVAFPSCSMMQPTLKSGLETLWLEYRNVEVDIFASQCS